MRLISLNTWAGRAGRDQLLNFFQKYKAETDIFCLQEIWHNGPDLTGKLAGTVEMGVEARELFKDIDGVLAEYDGYFKPHFREWYGLASFVRKDIPVLEEGDIFVYKYKGYDLPDDENVGNHARNIQYLTVQLPSGVRTIINFHGLWNGRGKDDCEERLAQSDNILQFIRNLKNDLIIAGDFNLLPNTQSLKILEDFGLRNLIKEYGITSTRTSFYLKPQKFADYVLVSSGIKVNDFEVLPDEVSDHSPMCLEFE